MKASERKVKGLLNPKRSEPNYQLRRYAPHPLLSDYVEQYWLVNWQLSQPHLQQNIPDPCIHLIWEKQQLQIVGPVTGMFERQLEGEGMIAAIKFKLCAFSLLFNCSADLLTDKRISAEQILPETFMAACDSLKTKSDDQAVVSTFEEALKAQIPAEKPKILMQYQRLNALQEGFNSMDSVTKLVKVLGIDERKLQRDFKKLIGLSPKQYLQKLRMQKSIDKLSQADLGAKLSVHDTDYYDQSHSIKAFKRFIGMTPGTYQKHQK